MTPRTRLAALIVLALLTGPAGVAGPPAGSVKLTAGALQALLAPHLLIAGWNDQSDGSFAVLFLPDGTAYSLFGTNTGGLPDTGSWRLDGDAVCTRFPRDLQGDIELCSAWYRLADGRYESRSVPWDNRRGTFRLVRHP